MISLADLQTLVDTAVRAAVQGVAGGGAHGGGHRLDERHFRRMDKFDGVDAKWKEWTFVFKTQIGMVNPTAREYLEEIQKHPKDPDWEDIFSLLGEDDRKKWGAELYGILVMLVTGEAMTVVRGVGDNDGWKAWHRLASRFDPRTPARALRAMMTVMQPKKVKDVRELQATVQDWENRMKQLKAEHDIDVDDKIKVALLTVMIPSELQDHVFQWAQGELNFKEIKDKILTLAMNRASLAAPMPMEVDKVWAEEWPSQTYQDREQHEVEDNQDQVEVDYVGEACRRCGGLGHYARECPTPKGKGKGDVKGKGKGKGKGKWDEYNQYGYKGKGKGLWTPGGKGFAGECWVCGEKGHRATECTKNKGKQSMEIGSVEEEVQVGGIWSIAQVEIEKPDKNLAEKDEFKEVRSRRSKRAVKKTAEADNQRERCVCTVCSSGRWKPVGSGEITIDSAAEESVCPKDWGAAYPLKDPAKWLRFTNASGGKMGHYGERRTTFKAAGEEGLIGMTFQASDVQKPLAAVWRIAEKGNRVCFGPGVEDNYIQNLKTGKKIQMVRKGGSYIVNADFVAEEGFHRQAPASM